MALVHEDGTGKSDAESYLSLVRAAEIAGLLDLTESWGVVAEHEQEALLRQATTFLDGHYRWRGTIVSTAQALGWPRIDVIDDQGREITSTAVPLALEKSTLFLAVQAKDQRLDVTQTGAAVIQFKVGPIERTYAGTGNTGQRKFLETDTLLNGLYRGGGQSSQVRFARLLRA